MSNIRDKITWVFTLNETDLRRLAIKFCVNPTGNLPIIRDKIVRFLHRREGVTNITWDINDFRYTEPLRDDLTFSDIFKINQIFTIHRRKFDTCDDPCSKPTTTTIVTSTTNTTTVTSSVQHPRLFTTSVSFANHQHENHQPHSVFLNATNLQPHANVNFTSNNSGYQQRPLTQRGRQF